MRYQLLCLAVFVIAYLLNITYITVFYHRGLTHGAVRLSPLAKRLVAATGNWVTGLDPKGWVCMHRLHHLHSDTALDPHAPSRFGIVGVLMGQLNSYKDILRKLGKRDPATTRVVADLDFPVSWLNRKKLWYAPYVLHAAVMLACGAAGMWLLGYAYFAGMMSHPVQGWMVNAFGHSMGYRNFATGDDSRNNTLVAWTVMGEGYQNNHHRFPKSAKFSVKWFELDMGYGLCLALEAIGMIKITRQPEAEVVPIELAASSY